MKKEYYQMMDIDQIIDYLSDGKQKYTYKAINVQRPTITHMIIGLRQYRKQYKNLQRKVKEIKQQSKNIDNKYMEKQYNIKKQETKNKQVKTNSIICYPINQNQVKSIQNLQVSLAKWTTSYDDKQKQYKKNYQIPEGLLKITQDQCNKMYSALKGLIGIYTNNKLKFYEVEGQTLAQKCLFLVNQITEIIQSKSKLLHKQMGSQAKVNNSCLQNLFNIYIKWMSDKQQQIDKLLANIQKNNGKQQSKMLIKSRSTDKLQNMMEKYFGSNKNKQKASMPQQLQKCISDLIQQNKRLQNENDQMMQQINKLSAKIKQSQASQGNRIKKKQEYQNLNHRLQLQLIDLRKQYQNLQNSFKKNQQHYMNRIKALQQNQKKIPQLKQCTDKQIKKIIFSSNGKQSSDEISLPTNTNQNTKQRRQNSNEKRNDRQIKLLKQKVQRYQLNIKALKKQLQQKNVKPQKDPIDRLKQFQLMFLQQKKKCTELNQKLKQLRQGLSKQEDKNQKILQQMQEIKTQNQKYKKQITSLQTKLSQLQALKQQHLLTKQSNLKEKEQIEKQNKKQYKILSKAIQKINSNDITKIQSTPNKSQTKNQKDQLNKIKDSIAKLLEDKRTLDNQFNQSQKSMNKILSESLSALEKNVQKLLKQEEQSIKLIQELQNYKKQKDELQHQVDNLQQKYKHLKQMMSSIQNYAKQYQNQIKKLNNIKKQLDKLMISLQQKQIQYSNRLKKVQIQINQKQKIIKEQEINAKKQIQIKMNKIKKIQLMVQQIHQSVLQL